MKKFLIVLSMLVSLTGTTFAGESYDKHDKALFTTVVLCQIADGLTTDYDLQRGNHIDGAWAWKYGTNTPSTGRMWGVKAAELVGAYYVGKLLPRKWRRVFFTVVGTTLILCAGSNISGGAKFSISF